MEGKAQSDDLDASLKTKYSNEVGLGVVLKEQNQEKNDIICLPTRTAESGSVLVLLTHCYGAVSWTLTLVLKVHLVSNYPCGTLLMTSSGVSISQSGTARKQGPGLATS